MESKYDYVVFDIETTGLHPDSDQICEIAAIGVKDGLPQGTFSTLVAIEGSMPEAAGRVNGITDDMLKGAPAIGDALDAFLDFIGDDAVLAGHNIASFDIPFMAKAAAKSGRVFIYPYVIDTLEAARERWRWSAIGAYPTLDMAVAVGEGFLSVKPYRVRRVTDVGDGFHDFLAEEVFANALTGRMRLLREKFGHKGRG